MLGELWRRREERKPVLIVVDEAHNVCPARPEDPLTAIATEHAVRIAGEGRKFGLYLLVSTQRPQKVHENVLSQCDNLLLMRMNSLADLGYVGEVFSFVPQSLLERATTFRQGESLAAGPIAPHPAFLRFGSRLAQEGGGDVPPTGRARSPDRAELHHLVDEVESLRPVRDQQHAAVVGRRQDVAHEQLGRLGVEVCGRLVEHEHRCIGEERPGDRQALTLPSGELRSLLADERVEPVGQRRDPLAEAAAVERILELGVRGLRAREGEVRTDGRVEDVRALSRDRERAPHVVLAQLAHVPAADRHPASLGIEKAQQQIRDRRLAGTARPDESDPPPRLQPEVEAGQHRRLAGCIAGGHAFERDGRRELGHGTRPVRDPGSPAPGRPARARAGRP